GLGAAWRLRHESMGPLWFFTYAIPVLCLAFVGSAVAARRLLGGARRATMAATIVLACLGWTLVRTEGISGDHDATFAWRWTKSPEERLLGRTAAGSRAPAPALPVVTGREEPPSPPVPAASGEKPRANAGVP